MPSDIKTITIEDNFMQEDVKQVALLTARELAINGLQTSDQIKNFYHTSGLKMIYRHLLRGGNIRDHFDSAFIEFSTIVSTLDRKDVLDAFTLVNDEADQKTGSSTFKKNVEKNFKAIVQHLRKEKLAIFNHPAFLINARKAELFISVMDGQDLGSPRNMNKRMLTCIKTADALFSRFGNVLQSAPSLSLEAHRDDLNESNVFINSSFIENMAFHEIKSPDTLKAYVDACGDPLALHLLNHRVYTRYFLDGLDSQRKTIFVSIPIVASQAYYQPGLPSENQPFLGLGSIFMFLRLKKKEPINLIEQITEYSETVPGIVKDFIHGYAFKISDNLRKEIELQATRAAISQVMARNMSHNIGSHVLSKLVSPEQVKGVMFNVEFNRDAHGRDLPEILRDATASEHDPFQYWSVHPNINDARNLKGGDKIAYFNSYLKSRMDFLADIATGTVPTLESSKFFYSELIANFDKNRVLLDRISGVSNFKFRILVYDCREQEKKQIQSTDDDFQVAIPNDILGCHAFYVILENLIRNTAKHSRHKDGVVDFCIEIAQSESGNQYYEIRIYDNCVVAETLFVRQNDMLNSRILDPKRNAIRDCGWGLMEMKVSAGYLQRQRIEEIDICTDALTAYIQVTDGKPSLGYKFKIAKPKEVLLVVDRSVANRLGDAKRLRDLEKQLRNYGIWFVGLSTGMKAISTFNDEDIYPHEIMAVLSKGPILCPGTTHNIPGRIILCTEEERAYELILKILEANMIGGKETQSIKEYLWELYYAKLKLMYEIHTLDIHTGGTVPGENHANRINAKFFDHAQGWPHMNDKYEYADIKTSMDKSAMILDKADKGKAVFDPCIRYKLQDSIVSQSIIIDERIQEMAYSNYYYGEEVKYHDIYRKTGIYVPNPSDHALSQKAFSKNEVQNLVTHINAIARGQPLTNNLRHLKRVRFLAIHLGLIEKFLLARDMRSSQMEVERIAIKEFVSELIQGAPTIKPIIISGRGKPPNLPIDIPFLNFSALSQYCVDCRNKYLLNELLHSTRNLA